MIGVSNEKVKLARLSAHFLWQIANALNNLILRLNRSVQAEHMLRRTELEVSRLKEEIHRAKAGQIPIWPQPSGTP